MNWLINILQKEARRFNVDDYVRYFSQPRKGRGKGVVITPSFSKGKVLDFDPKMKRYKIFDEKKGKELLVHPRNLVPDSISRNEIPEISHAPEPEVGFNTGIPPVAGA